MCKEKLDTQVLISQQPSELIQEIVDICVEKFPTMTPSVARSKVQLFLKNCQKDKRKVNSGLDSSIKNSPKVRFLSTYFSNQSIAR